MAIGHSGSSKVGPAGRLAPLILMASVGVLPAESPGGLHFERVESVSGPPSEVITALHQDRTGFIWIGSRDGLALYDGYSFTRFEHAVPPGDRFRPERVDQPRRASRCFTEALTLSQASDARAPA